MTFASNNEAKVEEAQAIIRIAFTVDKYGIRYEAFLMSPRPE